MSEQQKDAHVEVTSINDFAVLTANWFNQRVARIKHMRGIPEGTEVEVTSDDGKETVKLVLEGEALQAFKIGLETALDELGTLPFVMEASEASDENGAAS